MGHAGRILSWLLLTSMLLTTLTVAGCGNASETSVPESQTVKIGFLIDSVVVERWQRDRDIFSARAKELGAEVIVQNCNEDNDAQVRQIRDMTEQGVDVLVVIPYDKNGLSDAIRGARKRGIRVLSYDRLILNAEVDLYVSFDNVRVGELMGAGLLEKAPEGNYVIINGSPRDNNCDMLREGFDKALGTAVAEKRITIVSDTSADAWRPEVAYGTVNGLLDGNTRIDALIAANDGLAGGAIQSLTEHRLAGMVPVVGHDADISACQRIAEGTQYMTVYKPIKELAQSAAEAAVKLAKGEPVAGEDTIFDGTSEVPYIKFQPIRVVRENLVDTVIRDGFHSYEEVFRNVPESLRPPKP